MSTLALLLLSLAPASPAQGGLLDPAPIPGMTDGYKTLPSGQVMHYTETGPKTGKPILFVHGFPTSSFLYRKVIGEICGPLQVKYRCIAVDLIGFGSSSCPGDGSAVSPAYEADRLTEFITAMGLTNFALVVHDWGGPIGMAAGLRHSTKMTHLVILNTSLRFGSDGLLGPIQDFIGLLATGNNPLINATFPALVDVAMQAYTTTWLTAGVRWQYVKPYVEVGKIGCRVRAATDLFGKANQSDDLYDEIETGLTTKWAGKPTRFLWGADDMLLGPRSLTGIAAHNELATLVPQATTVVISGADHFMQEDKPVEIGQQIKDFLK